MLRRVLNTILVIFVLTLLIGALDTSRINAQAKDIKLEVSNKDFSADEDVTFELVAPAQSIDSLIKDNTYDVVDDSVNVSEDENIAKSEARAIVEDVKGNKFPIVSVYSDLISFSDTQESRKATVVIDREEMPGPGDYKIIISVDSKEIVQDFSWGVLAFNSNKDIYRTGEKAEFDISVLDPLGEMLCDASVSLKIVKPSGEISVLSTEKGDIETHDECRYTDYLLVPDYSAVFAIEELGTYSVEISAVTESGEHKIYDFFKAEGEIDFEIERHAPTRIYPPQEYPVIIEIKANKNFSGVIKEFVPEGFQLLTSEEDYLNTGILESVDKLSEGYYSKDLLFGEQERVSDRNKSISWRVDMKAGETYKLAYSFDADDVSPEFYVIDGLWMENKYYGMEWSVAADIVASTIDTNVHTTPYYHQGNGRNLVFINDQVGYAFFVDSDYTVGYSTTTNGGLTWGAKVALSSITNAKNITVWYDRWTPGNAGALIHVIYLDGTSGDVYYNNVDTNNSNSQKGEVVAIDRSTSGHSAYTDTISISMATDGDIYVAATSSIASSQAVVNYSQNTGTSWSATSDEGMDNEVFDYVMLMPLADADILLLRWDTSANTIDSKEYEDGADTWDSSFLSVDTNAIEDPNALGDDPLTQTWAATINPDTYDIYLAYVNGAGSTTAELETAAYYASYWTSKTSLLSATDSIMGTAIGINRNSKYIYVAYLRGSVNASNNAYYMVSEDYMSSWSYERGPVTSSSDDSKALSMNISSVENMGVFLFDDDDNDLFYGRIDDLGVSSGALTVSQMTGWESGILSEATEIVGSVSVTGSIKRSGDYSLRSNPTSGTGYIKLPVLYTTTGAVNTGDIDNYAGSFAFRVGTMPSSDTVFWQPAENTQKLEITLRSDGKLSINGTGDTLSVNSLDTDTWYMIAVTFNSDSDIMELRLYDESMENILEVLRATMSNLEDADSIYIGVQSSTTADLYFDDIMSYSNNVINNFPLVDYDYSIRRMDLDGTGTDTAWTNDYTYVNEIPADNGTYIQTSSVGDETSTLESAASAGITGSVLEVKVLNTVWESTSETSSVRTIRTRSPGIYETTALDVSPTSGTAYVFNQDYNRGGSNNLWTLSDLDSLEVGVGNDSSVTYPIYNGTTLVEISSVDTIDVSGYVYDIGTSSPLSECDAYSYTNELRMYSKGQYYQASCSSTDGSYTFSSVEKPDAGAAIVAWIDDSFAANTDGAMVLRYDGDGDSTGSIFYDNAVTLLSDDTNPITNTIMAYADSSKDNDIPYTVSTGNLTVNSGNELLIKLKSGVASGSTVYDPGGTVSTNVTGGDLVVESGAVAYLDTATNSIGRDIVVESGATLYIDASTSVSGGDVSTTGTGLVSRSTGSATVTVNGAGSLGGGSSSLSFYNLYLESSGTSTVTSNISVVNNLSVGDGTNSHSFDLNTNTKNLSVGGGVTIYSNGNLILASSGTYNFSGAYINNGTLTPNNSTITFDKGSGTASITGGSSAFYNVVFDDGGGGTIFELGGNLDVNNDLTINGGSLDVKSGSDYSINIGGDWENNDIFLERAGEVIFDGGVDTTVDSGCSDVSSCTNENFYDLTINKNGNGNLLSPLNTGIRASNLVSISRGTLSQGALNIRSEGTNAISIGYSGTWSNIATGDITLGGSLVNNGVLAFLSNNDCGGTDEIVIDSSSGVPSWSGSGSFELRDVSLSSQNAASAITLYSSTNAGGNTGSWTFNSGCTEGGSLITDIVDSGGVSVSSPSISMSAKSFSFSYSSSTGTFGTSSEKVRVSNMTTNSPWTLSIAASSGSTSFWDGVSSDYDFNDATVAAGDGGDSDSLGGQLSIDPSVGTVTPQSGCTNTGISTGSSSAFNEGSVDSITVTSAGGTAEYNCYWDITGNAVTQTIPGEQIPGSYSIEMMVSVIAN